MDLQEEIEKRSDFCTKRSVLVLGRELPKSQTAPGGVTARKCLAKALLGVCLGEASLASSLPGSGFR